MAFIPPASLQAGIVALPEFPWLDQNYFKLECGYTFKQNRVPQTISPTELLQAKDLGINLFGEDAEDFDIVDPPGGYFLTSIVWSAAYKNLAWQFRISNIFDTSYRIYTDRVRYFADDLGRNFTLRITYTI